MQGKQITVESVFITMQIIIYNEQHDIKTAKMLDTQNCLQNHIMLKQPHSFYRHPSTLPKEALANFYLSMTFGLSFMISFVAPTRSSTSYAYLITKIGNRNLKISNHLFRQCICIPMVQTVPSSPLAILLKCSQEVQFLRSIKKSNKS